MMIDFRTPGIQVTLGLHYCWLSIAYGYAAMSNSQTRGVWSENLTGGISKSVILISGLWKDVIELSVRGPAGMGWLTRCCWRFLTLKRPETTAVPVAPKNIEIAGNNDGFFYVFDHVVQVLQLILAMAEFNRQMHQKN